MREQTQPFGIIETVDETPQAFGVFRQTLAPGRMTLGGLLLGRAFVDAGGVS